MKKHKYTTIFSSEIKPLVSEEKDKEMLNNSIKDNQNLIAQIKKDIDTETDAAEKARRIEKLKTFILVGADC